MGDTYTVITTESKYKPHHKNVKIVNENGSICGIIAWWSDNPIQDAINEARKCVIMYEQYKVAVKRIVIVDNVPIFTSELHPLREKNCI